MQKISDSTNTANLSGEFTEGSSAAGVPATLLKAEWLNAIQRELVRVVTGGGLELDRTKDDQLFSAICRIIQSGSVSYSLDTGGANAYAFGLTPVTTSRKDGVPIWIKVKTSNTGASTVNDGIGTVPLVGGAHSALQGGEMQAGGFAWIQWNSTIGGGAYILAFCTGAPEQVAPATKSQHAMQLGQATGRLINITVFTSSGSFVPNAATKMLRVLALGAGGSGGYSLATAAGQTSTGSGGDAGAFGEIWVTSGIAATSVTVGAGGVGAGGGYSSFGSLLVCPGGAPGINGGAFIPPSQNVRTGAFLQPSGSGLFVIRGAGNGGLNGISLSASFAQGGAGGSTQYGSGGQGAISGIGGAGVGYGAGGGGAACLPSLGAQAGGSGAPGVVIVEEYS